MMNSSLQQDDDGIKTRLYEGKSRELLRRSLVSTPAMEALGEAS